MKDRYDFSKGKRGRVLLPEAQESGGVTGYQTLINAALREYLDGKAPRFEDTLRRIIRAAG